MEKEKTPTAKQEPQKPFNYKQWQKRRTRANWRKRKGFHIKNCLAYAKKRFPKCFANKPKEIQPLARGIQRSLREKMGWTCGLTWEVCRLYTRSTAYLSKCILPSTPRIDLLGNKVGEVTDTEACYARQKLAKREAFKKVVKKINASVKSRKKLQEWDKKPSVERKN